MTKYDSVWFALLYCYSVYFNNQLYSELKYGFYGGSQTNCVIWRRTVNNYTAFYTHRVTIDTNLDLNECQILCNEEKIWHSSRRAVLVIRAETIITRYRSQSQGPVLQLFTSLPYELVQTRLPRGHNFQSLT